MQIRLIVMAICGVIAAAIAARKGRSVVGWFFGGFFLGLIGVVIVAVISNKKQERERELRLRQQHRRLREQLRQEQIKSESFRRHAATRLDSHDQVLGVDTRSAVALPPPPPEGQLAAPAAVAAAQPQQETLWYYEVNGQSTGPVQEAEIKSLLHDSQLSGASLLWNEDIGEWTPLSKIPQFRAELRP